MDVVLQTAVLGVGLLQPVLHVLQLTLVATLHLNEKTFKYKLILMYYRIQSCLLPIYN